MVHIHRASARLGARVGSRRLGGNLASVYPFDDGPQGKFCRVVIPVGNDDSYFSPTTPAICSRNSDPFRGLQQKWFQRHLRMCMYPETYHLPHPEAGVSNPSPAYALRSREVEDGPVTTWNALVPICKCSPAIAVCMHGSLPMSSALDHGCLLWELE